MSNFSTIVQISGGLAFFLMGMTTMSDALQKVAGDRMRALLAVMTRNAFTGLLTGFFVTSIIQSSSATTVMLVSFVNAGLMNLNQAIGVILGANIGTTVTGWLVSVFGFKVKIASFALPAITVGFASKFFNKEKLASWGEVLLGFGLLFFGMSMMKHSLKTPENLAMVKGWMSFVHATNTFSRIYVILIGAAVTMIIQSSSATMALSLILAYQGIIDYHTGVALILGENIGTTITANLAALTANTAAKRAARAHFLFNGISVILVLITWPFWMKLIDIIIPGSTSVSTNLPIHMSAFHTAFNIINSFLFLPFVKYLAIAATFLVKEPKRATTKEMQHLEYIDYNLIPTPELALMAARKDIQLLGKNVILMLEDANKLLENINSPMGDTVTAIARQEEKIDKMSEGIVEYLIHLSKSSLSYENSHEVAGLLHTVADYERMGDHCEQLMKLLRRKHEHEYKFSEQAQVELLELAAKVKDFLVFVKENILSHADILEEAYKKENEINKLSKSLRKKNIERMSDTTCMIEGGLIFINMISSYEKIGDHNTNIAEEIAGVR